ncbi:hypothetical protein JCM11641_000020 [Rhodosporidiobolus odoratus]
MMSYFSLLLQGLAGHYGTIGLYSAVQRIFVAFGVFAFPGSLLIDAPFGRFLNSNRWTVNGRYGWLLMELISPLSFLYFLSTPPSTSPFSFPALSLTRIATALRALPPSRALLATFYLVHYFNRSILAELRNPGRSRMHLIIPTLSALFNVINGGTIGMYIGGGTPFSAPGSLSKNYGLEPGLTPRLLFGLGALLWFAGWASNIHHDNILFRLKATKQAELRSSKGPSPPSSGSSRYAIPHGGLYRLLSHPSYTSEWVEWIGFTLCTLSLSPGSFPPPASSPLLSKLPAGLRPLQDWWLQPPALFVLEEVAAMLPRARSGHRWYKKTFGKEWEQKGARWVVVPGVY